MKKGRGAFMKEWKRKDIAAADERHAKEEAERINAWISQSKRHRCRRGQGETGEQDGTPNKHYLIE